MITRRSLDRNLQRGCTDLTGRDRARTSQACALPPLCTPAFACQGRCRAAPTRVFCAPWGEGVKRAASRALPLFLLVSREWRYTFIWDCYAVGTPDMRTRSLWEGGGWAETIWPNRATGDRRLPYRPAWSRARTPDDSAVGDRGELASGRGVRFGHQRMTTGRSRSARTCRCFDGPR